jgi:hypothetical protein
MSRVFADALPTRFRSQGRSEKALSRDSQAKIGPQSLFRGVIILRTRTTRFGEALCFRRGRENISEKSVDFVPAFSSYANTRRKSTN